MSPGGFSFGGVRKATRKLLDTLGNLGRFAAAVPWPHRVIGSIVAVKRNRQTAQFRPNRDNFGRMVDDGSAAVDSPNAGLFGVATS